MNPEQTEKYTTCDRCGKEILEQCAIEDSGRFLCGDCVVKTTDSEVREAEKVLKKLREDEYQHLREETVKKQKKKILSVFLFCLAILICVQIFNYYSAPKPTASTKIAIDSNRETIRKIIIIGISSYMKDNNGIPPDNLKQLSPNYISPNFSIEADRFEYQKNGTTYILK